MIGVSALWRAGLEDWSPLPGSAASQRSARAVDDEPAPEIRVMVLAIGGAIEETVVSGGTLIRSWRC